MPFIDTAIEGIGAAAVVLGVAYAAGRVSRSVEANTEATKDLTEAFTAHSAKTDERLNELDVRVSVIETKLEKK